MAKAEYRRVSFDVHEGSGGMHSHDRTLLSKLGFSDKDKREPRHDLACQYLRQPDVLMRLFGARVLAPSAPVEDGELMIGSDAPSNYRFEEEAGDLCKTLRAGADFADVIRLPKGASLKHTGKPSVECEAYLERALNKGEGQYKATVGFLDVSGTITVSQKVKVRWPLRTEKNPKKKIVEWRGDSVERTTFALEVKIGVVLLGDVLRQMALYKEYDEDCEVRAVVVDFDIDSDFEETLAEHNIFCARLGSDFDTWLKRRKKKAAKAAPVRTV